MRLRVLLMLLIQLQLFSCGTSPIRVSAQPDARPVGEEAVTIYALGDWGTGDERQRAVAIALREDIRELEKASPEGRPAPLVVELGDNIYPNGLPKRPWKDSTVFALLENTFGNKYHDVRYRGAPVHFYVLPGNHDYARGFLNNDKEWGDVIHQETTAESLYSNFHYYPLHHSGIPDSNDREEFERLQSAPLEALTAPQKIPLPERAGKLVSLYALDTQMFLDLYAAGNDSLIHRYWQQLHEVLQTDSSLWKIFLGHHPTRTYGRHGGFYRLKEWVWSGTRDFIPPYVRPLTFLWVPALTVMIDKWLVRHPQDLDNRYYKAFARDLEAVMRKYGITLYISGHEHNLQLIRIRNRDLNRDYFQVISGAAGRTSEVPGPRGNLLFSHHGLGFVRVEATPEALWLKFVGVEGKSGTSHSLGQFRLTVSGIVQLR